MVLAPVRFRGGQIAADPRRMVIEALVSQPAQMQPKGAHRSDSPQRDAETIRAERAEIAAERAAYGLRRTFAYPRWCRWGSDAGQLVVRDLHAAAAGMPGVTISETGVTGTPEQIAELIKVVMVPLQAEHRAERERARDAAAVIAQMPPGSFWRRKMSRTHSGHGVVSQFDPLSGQREKSAVG